MTEKGPFDAEVHFRCIVDKPKERRLFDAVTEVLRGYIAKKSRHGGFDKATENLIAEFTVAIRFLEAAGKINRDRDLRVLATLLKVYVQGEPIPELEQGLKGGAVREIRALLEALPDGEGGYERRHEAHKEL
jgi:hypothetical protein